MSQNFTTKLIVFIICVVFVIGTFVLFMNDEGIFITGLILNTFNFVIAAFSLFMLLYLLDINSDVDFKERTRMITTDARAAALYFGLRAIGVALLAGFIYA